METENKPREVATLGGGCFWCLEPVFADVKGVLDAEVGYAGGSVPNPTYERVCTGTTGHAEVVQVTFDPGIISYREILEIFFSVHDPTTRNRQGADVGPQYRSVIFYRSEQQRQTAEALVSELNSQKAFDQPIVTEIVPFETFYRAEEYHQEYYQKNPYAGYCQMVVRPKVNKFRKQYAERLGR